MLIWLTVLLASVVLFNNLAPRVVTEPDITQVEDRSDDRRDDGAILLALIPLGAAGLAIALHLLAPGAAPLPSAALF